MPTYSIPTCWNCETKMRTDKAVPADGSVVPRLVTSGRAYAETAAAPKTRDYHAENEQFDNRLTTAALIATRLYSARFGSLPYFETRSSVKN
jgi:hypothetical protein